MAGTRTTALALVGAGAAVAAHAAPALSNVDVLRRRLLPGLSGVGSPGHVALTFDDGPQPESTPAFLEALDRLGWKATFFMLGSMVDRSPGLAAEVAAAGHEVAVHGYDHRSEMFRIYPAIASDLARAVDAVSAATDRRQRWFRPPYGTLSGGGVIAARRQGLRTVLWSTWGRDWRAEATPRSVVADVERHLGPGATVLLHDSDCTSAPEAWRSALGALDPLAELFAARGLTVGPLAEHGLTPGTGT
ncbi:MAG TPA: polysaccharide deacetylase family protein [Acidimicrobiales bacterium]|nr:polysaccharide deacetylase family protein [Acidimicrobiales bacterium]